ncbi:hypothetical protein HEK131_46470 [Streptomyces seoulensis]|nr:hypothetical protein HEK131_46470 [Streptomyces seoulensis]
METRAAKRTSLSDALDFTSSTVTSLRSVSGSGVVTRVLPSLLRFAPTIRGTRTGQSNYLTSKIASSGFRDMGTFWVTRASRGVRPLR